MEETSFALPRKALVFLLLLLFLALGPAFAAAGDASDANAASRQTSNDVFDQIFKDLRSLAYPSDESSRVRQERIPASVAHPCEVDPERPTWRSKRRPMSAHELRPGDIDVIAALGDSLTSANSAREAFAIGVAIQDRGVSLSGGGVGTWREVTTLPNIIKVFNPKLVGFAKGRGDFLSDNAQLNVAFPAALDGDLVGQVKLLVQKMRKDRRIDFDNDWKLLTIFIGHNNLCSYNCIDRKRHSAENHRLNIQKALDYLYTHAPRVFVNIISVLDPTLGTRVPSTIMCDFFRRLFCACLFHTEDFTENKFSIRTEARRYQAAEEELASNGRYDGREDFAVTFQPFSSILNGPKEVGEPENPMFTKLMTERPPIWSADCFHLNQRGLASGSILLWNNMLEPVGNKSRTFEDITIDEYKCPTKKNPYFFTKRNSETFYKEGHQ